MSARPTPLAAGGGADADLVEQELGRRGALADELARQEAVDGTAFALGDPEEHVLVGEEGARVVVAERRLVAAATFHVEVGVVARNRRQDGRVVGAEPADRPRHLPFRTRNERR